MRIPPRTKEQEKKKLVERRHKLTLKINGDALEFKKRKQK